MVAQVFGRKRKRQCRSETGAMRDISQIRDLKGLRRCGGLSKVARLSRTVVVWNWKGKFICSRGAFSVTRKDSVSK